MWVPPVPPPLLCRGESECVLVAKGRARGKPSLRSGESWWQCRPPLPPRRAAREEASWGVKIFAASLSLFWYLSKYLKHLNSWVDGRSRFLPLSPSGEKKGDNSSPGTMTVSDAFCSIAVYTAPPLVRNPSQIFLGMLDAVPVGAGVPAQRPNQISLGALLPGTCREFSLLV